jgi:hypothetical protein
VNQGMFRPHRWVFTLAPGKDVEVAFTGANVTAEHVRALRAHLELLERTISSPAPGGEPDQRLVDPATPGDLVQIAPATDPVYGGLVARVTQETSTGIRAYLLVPHRGGTRETWQSFNRSEVERVGRVKWPEAEWGFRSGNGRRGSMWSD